MRIYIYIERKVGDARDVVMRVTHEELMYTGQQNKGM